VHLERRPGRRFVSGSWKSMATDRGEYNYGFIFECHMELVRILLTIRRHFLRPRQNRFDNFEPTDRFATLVLNRNLGETIQRITGAQREAGPEFQLRLTLDSTRNTHSPLLQECSATASKTVILDRESG
jgi:hypothetical protein